MRPRTPFLLGCFALAGGALAADDLDALFPRSTIVISASRDACYRFDVHVAATPAEQRRGLMFVRELPPFGGMLFVYRRDAVRSMWMKNTFIPLDMLFVRADGTIASLATDTEPQSLRSISSDAPVRYVLELNAGTAARLGIDAGDRMQWSGDVTPSQD